jgi:protein-tyrosine phosphatase
MAVSDFDDERAEVYWVALDGPGRLGFLPAPFGAERLRKEIRSLRAAGVGVLVSLLTDEEVAILDLGREGEECAREGIEFIRWPVPDYGVPDDSARAFAEDLARRVREGRAVAIHCRAAVGRSPTITAAVLVALGVPPEDALLRLEAARGFPVPETAEQLDWILRLR